MDSWPYHRRTNGTRAGGTSRSLRRTANLELATLRPRSHNRRRTCWVHRSCTVTVQRAQVLTRREPESKAVSKRMLVTSSSCTCLLLACYANTMVKEKRRLQTVQWYSISLLLILSLGKSTPQSSLLPVASHFPAGQPFVSLYPHQLFRVTCVLS